MASYRDVLIFVGLAVFWGGSFPAIEVGLRDFPPLLFTAARYELGGLILLGYAIMRADRWRPAGRDDYLSLLGVGIFLIAGNSLLFVGQQFTTGSVASIIYSLIPILTTVLAWAALPDDRPTRIGLLGIALGLLGVGVIVRPDPANLLGEAVIGKALVFVAALSIAVGSILVRRTRSTLPNSAFMAWSMFVGAALLHLASLGVGESLTAVRFTMWGTISLLYIAILSTAVAFVMYFFLIRTYGPLETNLVSYLSPVVATLAGWTLLGEALTVWAVLGFLLIFAGFVLVKQAALRAAVGELRDSVEAL